MKLIYVLLLVLVLQQALGRRLRRLKKGALCDYDPDWCRRGLTCLGEPGNMRCIRVRGLGQKCGRRFTVCEEGLECDGKICVKPKIGRGGSCNSPDDVCEDGLSCVGTKRNKKCFALKKLGERCRGVFWVCEDGLVCGDNHRCVKPKIGKGGSCNRAGDVCEDGLTCVGNKGNKKCFAQRKLGMSCGKDPFWVCENGLDCEDNICVKPKIGKGGSCNRADDVCEDGLSCVGTRKNKKCFALKKLGEKCRGVFWVCEDGLVCNANHRCEKPKLGKGESCNDAGDVCEDGLTCVGNEGNKKCFALRKLGMACGKDPFWVCEAGLDCEDNVCTKPKIGEGESCNDAGDVCEDGLSCLGRPGKKICTKPKIGEGESCNDAGDVCEDGLSCLGRPGKKICTKPKIGEGESCNDAGDVCEDGLSCLGRAGNKKCFAKRKKGETCGRDPFWVCEDGLLCKHKICVKH